jgi:hypothetical protein
MYTVRSNQDATAPTRVGEKPQANNWQSGTVQQVDAGLIKYYQDHADVFEILGGDGALTEGVETAAGITAANVTQSLVQQVTFTLADVEIAVTDTLAYASKKIFTFPEGRILLLAAVASLKWAVLTDRATTINASASLTWALGSVAASNITLTSTMINMLAKQTTVLDGAATAYTAAATAGALAASAQFDGTGTPTPVFLNCGFETDTQIDGDATLAAKGTVTLTYLNAGDY